MKIKNNFQSLVLQGKTNKMNITKQKLMVTLFFLIFIFGISSASAFLVSEKYNLTKLCSDGILNYQETDIDCGGICGKCEAEKSCFKNSDCLNDDCYKNICQISNEKPAIFPIKTPFDFWLIPIAIISILMIYLSIGKVSFPDISSIRIPTIRLKMPNAHIYHKGGFQKWGGRFKTMFSRNGFDKGLTSYLNRQNPREWKLELAPKRNPNKAQILRKIEDSIKYREEFKEKQKIVVDNKIPFMQRKAVKKVMSPFIPIFEKSKPEDFIKPRKVILTDSGQPKISKVMNVAIKLDKSFRRNALFGDKKVRILFNELKDEKIASAMESMPEKVQNKFIEDKNTRKTKGLLNEKSTFKQGKHHAVKTFMLDGLKETYK